MGELTPERRVGDRERRAVDDHLMAAAADGVLTLAEYDERTQMLWRARTRTELDRLVADLPSTPCPASPVVPGGEQPPRLSADFAPHRRRPIPDGEQPPRLSPDFAPHRRRLATPVLPGRDVTGWSVMGKVVLDLRRDDLPDQVHVRARTLMGEVEVLVSPGTTVHLSGASVMGERKVEVDGGTGPVVHWMVIASGTDARAVFVSDEIGAGDSRADINVGVLFNSVEVVVPDGTRVDKGGLVLFGSVECEDACRGSGPVIAVRSLGGFGSVTILRQS